MFSLLNDHKGFKAMTLLLAIILAFLLIGTVPVWPHSIHWGYYPSGGIGFAILIV